MRPLVLGRFRLRKYYSRYHYRLIIEVGSNESDAKNLYFVLAYSS